MPNKQCSSEDIYWFLQNQPWSHFTSTTVNHFLPYILNHYTGERAWSCFELNLFSPRLSHNSIELWYLQLGYRTVLSVLLVHLPMSADLIQCLQSSWFGEPDNHCSGRLTIIPNLSQVIGYQSAVQAVSCPCVMHDPRRPVRPVYVSQPICQS